MKSIPRESYIPLGLIFGAGIGSLTDNLSLWVALGLCVGVAIYTVSEEKGDPPSEE